MKNLIVLNDMGGSVMNVSDIPCTLRSQMKHHEPIVCYEEDPMKVLCFKERAGCPGGGKGILVGEDRSFTLATNFNGAICFEPGIAKREGSDSRFVTGKSPTLRANAGDNQVAVCYAVDSHPMDSRFEIDGDISPTVTAKLAKGSADGPLVIVDNDVYVMSERQISMMVTKNVSNFIVSTDYKGSQVICMVDKNDE